jgi:30S ribosomal protein S31
MLKDCYICVLTLQQLKLIHMGKGDKKSRRGKIHIGSYGVRRRQGKAKTKSLPEAKVEEPVLLPKPKPAPKSKPAKPEAVGPEIEMTEKEIVETAKAVKPPSKKKPAGKAS